MAGRSGNRPVLVVLLVLLVAVLGCSANSTQVAPGEKQEKDVVVRIATINGPSAMSMVRTITENYSLGANFRPEYIIKDNPELVKAMMLNKQVDIATVPTTLASVLYNKQRAYQVAAVTVWGTLYLVGDEDSVVDWDSLRHKKVHLMGKGMTPDVVFRYLLKQKGLDPEKDVKLDYSFPMPADLANAVAAGKVKLALLSEPTASMVLAKNSALMVKMDLNEEWDQAVQGIPLPQTCVVVKKEFAQQYPEVVEAYLKSYKESTEWVNDNPIEAGDLIASYQILPNPKIAAASIPRSNILYKEVNSVKDGINAYLQLFHDFDPKIVGGKLPDEGFYYQR